jgi:hypothetical protein
VTPTAKARLARALWLVLAFCIWNDLFDAYVDGGMYAYLTERAYFDQGLAPRPTIDGFMTPAIRRGLVVASAAAAGVAAFGLAAVRYAAARQPPIRSARGSPGPPPPSASSGTSSPL